MRKYILLVFLVFSFVLGLTTGVIFVNTTKEESQENVVQKHKGQNRLINSLLDYKIPPSKELGPFRYILEKKVEEEVDKKNATSIGIMYQDLNNGPWVGVNLREKFIPASLLKMPIMMVYFKQADSNPSILSKKITYSPVTDYNTQMYYKPKQVLTKGEEYTVDELITRMITFSDNNAAMLLYDNINKDTLNSIYKDLGVTAPNVSSTEDFMSPIDVATFLRVIYNTTYMSPHMSQKALELLTHIDFKDGIRNGVPKNILVANKYGERDMENINELHDCGIVYYPNRPYILCVMTKGSDIKKLAQIISDISTITYNQVDSQNKGKE